MGGWSEPESSNQEGSQRQEEESTGSSREPKWSTVQLCFAEEYVESHPDERVELWFRCCG